MRSKPFWRTLGFVAVGWSVPDLLRGRWQVAAIALLVACLCFISLLYEPAAVSEGRRRG